jgi:hypothetical protein
MMEQSASPKPNGHPDGFPSFPYLKFREITVAGLTPLRWEKRAMIAAMRAWSY